MSSETKATAVSLCHLWKGKDHYLEPGCDKTLYIYDGFLMSIFVFIYHRSSPRPAIETCTREFTRVSDRFIVRLAEYSFGKKLTCKSIRKRKATFKPPKSTRKRSATDCCHPTKTPASVRPLRKRTHVTSTGCTWGLGPKVSIPTDPRA